MSYKEAFESAKSDPEKFWMEAASHIDWVKPPSKALFSDNEPFYEWFKDAEVNSCYNAVDRHVLNGKGDQTAIIYDSPITDTKGKVFICRAARAGQPHWVVHCWLKGSKKVIA